MIKDKSTGTGCEEEIVNISRYEGLEKVIEFISKSNDNNYKLQISHNYCITTRKIMEILEQESDGRWSYAWEVVNDLFIPPPITILKRKVANSYLKKPMSQDGKNWFYIRMGISLNIFDQTVKYLKNRHVGKQEQIKLELIKKDIAQFLTEITSIQASQLDKLNQTSINIDITNLNNSLTRADENILNLCGAHGYTSGGIIYSYYYSRIIKSIYGQGEGLS